MVAASTNASTNATPHPTNTTPNRLRYPYPPSSLQFHPALSSVLTQYATRKEIMHTLFYGPPSSGKLTLARQLIAVHTHMPIAIVERLTTHTYQLRDKEFPFYKTVVHFEMSVADFVPNHQKTLIELLQELSKTLNVSRNTYKIILLHEADQLSRPIQYQLRRMMEVFYTTCRLVFLSHNLDRLDQTLQSRIVCVRVPRPRSELMHVRPSSESNLVPPSLPPTVEQWLTRQADTLGVHYTHTIIDHTVDQLWRALLRKTIPLPTFRKWVRVISMTHLSVDNVMYRLLLKRIVKTPTEMANYNAIVNYYLHQHDMLRHSHNGELQLEMLLCALHTSLHGSSEAFGLLMRRVRDDVV